MKRTPLLIRAFPQKIEVKERYRYHLLLAANADTLPVGKPEGKIRVIIPFDGAEHFPRSTADFLSRYAPEEAQAQVGWLALGLPLNWDQDWGRPIGAEILPVRIPLKEKGMKTPEGWWRDTRRAVVGDIFEVPLPRFWPLELTLQVFDSQQASLESLEEYLQWHRILWSSKERREDWENLKETPLFWEFTVTVWIPNILTRDNLLVEVQALRLKWPTVAASGELSVFVSSLSTHEGKKSGGKDEEPTPWWGRLHRGSWRYNLDQQAIEIQGFTLMPESTGRMEGSPLQPYRAKIYLALHTLGPVITADELTGELQVRIEGLLLSGREAIWLDGSGRHASKAPLHLYTDLEAEFEAYLSDQFAIRRNAVYQQWHFPGVSMEENRLTQIAAALSDLGYRVHSRALHEDDGVKSGVLSAERWVSGPEGGVVHLELEIQVEGMGQSTTTHKRNIPGGLEVITERKTEDLRVHVLGWVSGPGMLLTSDLARLFKTLSIRLEAVADIR